MDMHVDHVGPLHDQRHVDASTRRTTCHHNDLGVLINNATIDQAATSKVGWQKSFLELGDERLAVHQVHVSCQWVAGTRGKLVVRASIDPDMSHENDDGKPSEPRHTKLLLDPGR